MKKTTIRQCKWEDNIKIVIRNRQFAVGSRTQLAQNKLQMPFFFFL
jgi:hypothetical protein